MTTQPHDQNQTETQSQNFKQKQTDLSIASDIIHDKQRFKQSLDALFNPFIRVVPEKDWSKIKAIWIPFLHHDYKNKLEKSDTIKIVGQTVDKFGTIQGYLLASNGNYIPYLTTFFNPTLTQDQVIEKILQAEQNVLEIEQIITDPDTKSILRKAVIGVAKSGMLIAVMINQDNNIIDAFPIFHKEPS